MNSLTSSEQLCVVSVEDEKVFKTNVILYCVPIVTANLIKLNKCSRVWSNKPRILLLIAAGIKDMWSDHVSGRHFGEKIWINRTCSLSYNAELLPPCWQWEGNFPVWKLETGNVGPGLRLALTTSVLPHQRKKKKKKSTRSHCGSVNSSVFNV